MPRITSLLRCIRKEYGVADMTIKNSNLPESYIKRAMEKVDWRTPKGVQYRRAEIKKKKFQFGVDRPWTQQFEQHNQRRRRKIFIEPVLEWSFFKGDRVEVLVGKDKGKQGLVNCIIQERNWVMVEGLNTKFTRIGQKKGFPGMMLQEEKPLSVTEGVALIDPSDNKPTEVEWRFTEDGEYVRVSRRTGRIIPIPKMAEETPDYKTKSTYVEREKDTTEEELTKITFKPSLKTFYMDIADKMGIKDDRVPQKTYWY